jgi:hypothetical protein
MDHLERCRFMEPSFEGGLLVAQSLDWVEPRRLARRVEAEKHTYRSREGKGEDHRVDLNNHGPAPGYGNSKRSSHSQHDADDTTNERECY